MPILHFPMFACFFRRSATPPGRVHPVATRQTRIHTLPETLFPIPSSQIGASAQKWDQNRMAEVLREAVVHNREGKKRYALSLVGEVYRSAYLAENYRTCLRLLNCAFSFHTSADFSHLPTLHQYSVAQCALCELVGSSDPIACIVGYTDAGSCRLVEFNPVEAGRLFDLAEKMRRSIDPTNEHTLEKLKVILKGRIQACMDTCRRLPSNYVDAREPLVRCTLESMDRLMQMELSPTERATAYRDRADTLLLCSSPPDTEGATHARLAMYGCIAPREFDPTCPVCMEHMPLGSPDTMVMGCFHTVHRECFSKCPPVATHGTELTPCPVCRRFTHYM